MKTKLIYSSQEGHEGYGAGWGDVERYEYECPCKKGKIIEEHDNIPGFRDHYVYIDCLECRENFVLDLSKGVRGWEIIDKKK